MPFAALPVRCIDRHSSVDELDRAIANLTGRINASTHDFLDHYQVTVHMDESALGEKRGRTLHARNGLR